MTICENTWKRPKIFNSDLASFYALFRSIVRFALEKHGGTMETDPHTGTTHIGIPEWAEEACLEELGELVGPGKPLHSFLPFLVD